MPDNAAGADRPSGHASNGAAPALLSVRALEVSYGPVIAVRNLSLRVGAG